MKNIVSKLLSSSAIFSIALAPVLSLTSCSNEQLVTWTESYWNNEQVKTVHSLRKMNGSKDLLYLDYTADYKLDEYIKTSPGDKYGDISRTEAFNNVLLNGKSKYKLPTPTNSKACTGLAVNGSDGKQYLARSMDWNYDGSFDMILRTHANEKSGSKYDTLSMVHTTYMYGQYDKVNEPSHAEALLYAPYSDATDGFNSAGLGIAQIDLEFGPTKQDKKASKPYVPYSLLSRLVLDKCATVEEAITLIKNDYAFYADAYVEGKPDSGTNIHWLITDAKGYKANVVFEGSDGFDKPNIAITYQPTTIKSFDGYNVDEGSFKCSFKYADNNTPTTNDSLWIENFYLNNFKDDGTKAKYLNLHESEGYWRHFAIQKYLATHGNKLNFEQIKHILQLVKYSVDVDMFVRYVAQGDDPLDPQVWENWMSTYSVIYNLTDRKMTVWKLENFDVAYTVNM